MLPQAERSYLLSTAVKTAQPRLARSGTAQHTGELQSEIFSESVQKACFIFFLTITEKRKQPDFFLMKQIFFVPF